MRHLLFISTAILASVASAGDWPQMLGPMRNGQAAGDTKLLDQFPAEGPPITWTYRIGEGYSGPAVAGDRVVVFHRDANDEVVACLNATTGKVVWSKGYPSDFRDQFGFDDGPRAVPTIHADRIYTYGAGGMLQCLNLTDGHVAWRIDTRAKLQSDAGFFGRACSPLVEGDQVIVQIGGAGGSGIVAFDKTTGEVRWKATDHEAGYSSPVAATLNGHRMLLALTREGFVGLNPADGSIRFSSRFRSRARASVNASTPLVIDDAVFLSACYNVGAAMFRILPEGPKQIWANDESLSNHFMTSVYHDGFLYGFHGRQDTPPAPEFRCVEANSGKVRWSVELGGVGYVIFADGKLLILTEHGELILAPASPEAFNPTGKARILNSGIRAMPALAQGRLYARDRTKLVCVDLNR